MSLRNLLKAGELVVPVPIGVLMTLQYNRDGNLEKVYTGIQDDRIDVTRSKLVEMINNKTVPAKIHITNGTTFVEGVLYTSDIQTKKSWDSYESLNDILFSKYAKNPNAFNFFGANIRSYAINISGSVSINRYLKTTGFNIMNGFIMPIGDTDALIHNFINGDMYPFMKVAMGYYTYGAEAKYISGGIHQHIVHSVERFTDINGYIKMKVGFKEFQIYIDYSDAVKYRISKGTTVILDESNMIVFCFGGKETPPSTIKCDCCGKLIAVPDSGLVMCSDTHCPSMLYPQISQFIHKLGILPEITEDEFIEMLDIKEISCVSDILSLPEYNGIKIHTTISTLLRAMIPYRLIGTDTLIDIFINKCTNAVDTIIYYTDHPDRITSDLHITDIGVNRLVCWLSDQWNAEEFKSLLMSDKFVFDTVQRSFDGPPIFRGKKIYVTGKFIHGSIIDICNILQSYSAEATMIYSADVDCVVIGEMNEDNDGPSIQFARNKGIPIFSELDFFNQYEIDDDLNKYGLVMSSEQTT